jgi:hypothetical protein
VNDDDRLRDLFRGADRAQRAGAPSFAGLLRRERPPRTYRPALLAAAASILLAAIAVHLLRDNRPEPPWPDSFYSSARWEGPTDFLLETPGGELLHSTPQIGAPPTPEAGSPEPEKGTRT